MLVRPHEMIVACGRGMTAAITKRGDVIKGCCSPSLGQKVNPEKMQIFFLFALRYKSSVQDDDLQDEAEFQTLVI